MDAPVFADLFGHHAFGEFSCVGEWCEVADWLAGEISTSEGENRVLGLRPLQNEETDEVTSSFGMVFPKDDDEGIDADLQNADSDWYYSDRFGGLNKYVEPRRVLQFLKKNWISVGDMRVDMPPNEARPSFLIDTPYGVPAVVIKALVHRECNDAAALVAAEGQMLRCFAKARLFVERLAFFEVWLGLACRLSGHFEFAGVMRTYSSILGLAAEGQQLRKTIEKKFTDVYAEIRHLDSMVEQSFAYCVKDIFNVRQSYPPGYFVVTRSEFHRKSEGRMCSDFGCFYDFICVGACAHTDSSVGRFLQHEKDHGPGEERKKRFREERKAEFRRWKNVEDWPAFMSSPSFWELTSDAEAVVKRSWYVQSFGDGFVPAYVGRPLKECTFEDLRDMAELF